MTGSGGWPLNVFLTHDKKPFYGGTYFPPNRAHGRASWKEVLVNVSQYYSQNRDEVIEQANKLHAHLLQLSISNQVAHNEPIQSSKKNEPDFKEMRNKLLGQADIHEGGFGQAPKFPSTFSLGFLFNYAILREDAAALQQVILSLDKMMMGGIYDQIRGGFARYSTDKYWIAPHFEKMLYDNGLID